MCSLAVFPFVGSFRPAVDAVTCVGIRRMSADVTAKDVERLTEDKRDNEVWGLLGETPVAVEEVIRYHVRGGAGLER
jgi:hypothetical protein